MLRKDWGGIGYPTLGRLQRGGLMKSSFMVLLEYRVVSTMQCGVCWIYSLFRLTGLGTQADTRRSTNIDATLLGATPAIHHEPCGHAGKIISQVNSDYKYDNGAKGTCLHQFATSRCRRRIA
jgi:hypothetical protein